MIIDQPVVNCELTPCIRAPKLGSLSNPFKERLRLPVMILNDLTAADDQIEFSDSWTDQDLQDLTTFALSHSENPHEKHRNRP